MYMRSRISRGIPDQVHTLGSIIALNIQNFASIWLSMTTLECRSVCGYDGRVSIYSWIWADVSRNGLNVVRVSRSAPLPAQMYCIASDSSLVSVTVMFFENSINAWKFKVWIFARDQTSVYYSILTLMPMSEERSAWPWREVPSTPSSSPYLTSSCGH